MTKTFGNERIFITYLYIDSFSDLFEAKALYFIFDRKSHNDQNSSIQFTEYRKKDLRLFRNLRSSQVTEEETDRYFLY